MIKVGLLGLGNVGKGVYDILTGKSTMITERVGEPIEIKSIAVRNPEKYQNLISNDIHLTTNVDEILEDEEIKIVVETIGGQQPAYDYICKALRNKKFVVTANKEVISIHKEEFFEIAKKNDVDIYFEAAVGGGIPIIRSLKVGFAGNRIDSLYGILNGTTNYILTKIEEERLPFDDVLKTAQELGFAEADPTMDISGCDTAHKLVILAAVAFKANIQLENIYYEGIEKLSLTDILYAKEFGYTIRLLAIGNRIDDQKMSFKVHPTMIPNTHPLASVRNELNAVYVTGDAVGEALLSGKGAGGSPTGSAVVSDIIDIAFDTSHRISRRNLETDLNTIDVVPIEETESQYFLRMSIKDTYHVLEKITGILGQNKASISKIIQNEATDGKAEIVIITHLVKEANINKALESFKALPEVHKLETVIRVRLDEA
ncbi:MAG: homoserine dehydrogenase [Candidatus Marinamargulisbacteria bacterium]|jgi:homoserine dehydrogenase